MWLVADETTLKQVEICVSDEQGRLYLRWRWSCWVVPIRLKALGGFLALGLDPLHRVGDMVINQRMVFHCLNHSGDFSPSLIGGRRG